MNKYYLISIFLLFLTGNVNAQGEDQFLPSEIKQLTAVTEPATLHQGFFKIWLNYNYTSIKYIFDNEANKYLIPGASSARSSSVNLVANYGISDRIEVNIWLPYMLNKNENIFILDNPAAPQTTYGGQVNGFGLGDISVGMRTQVLLEQNRLPSLTLGTYLELPTGRKNPTNETGYLEFDEATGSGEFSLGIEAQVRKIVYPYSFSFNSGFEYKTGGKKIHQIGEEEVPFKSGNVFYAIAGINFHLNDWICVTNDFNYTLIGSYTKDNKPEGDPSWAFSWTPNIHFQIKKLRLAQGFIVPIMGRNFGADRGYIFIVQYVF